MRVRKGVVNTYHAATITTNRTRTTNNKTPPTAAEPIMRGICSISSPAGGASVEGVAEVRTTSTGVEEAMVGGMVEEGGGTAS